MLKLQLALRKKRNGNHYRRLFIKTAVLNFLRKGSVEDWILKWYLAKEDKMNAEWKKNSQKGPQNMKWDNGIRTELGKCIGFIDNKARNQV